jgi:uncharacterized membrane protein YadS
MNDEIASAAVITKLARVMLLGPYLVILSKFTQRSDKGKTNIAMPWFAVAFVLVAGINSMAIIPPAVVKLLTKSSGIMFLTAMVRFPAHPPFEFQLHLMWYTLVLCFKLVLK